MNTIRKISVGNGHPDSMMHYQVGRVHNLGGNVYTLVKITHDTELFNKGIMGYNIYIKDDISTILWKTLINVPTVVEFNIDFE